MTIQLNFFPPSVNNLPVRVFLRAVDLPFEEKNVFGETRSDEYMEKVPSHLTPSIENDDHPRDAMWESCAIMMYLSTKHNLEKFYPSDPGRRSLVDSANFYLTGMLYPHLARATYPRLEFSSYPGEVAAAENAGEELKTQARKEAEEALLEPLSVYDTYFVQGGFIGDGDHPSIADIRLACSLEFLPMCDFEPSAWVHDYRERVETTLGQAYIEPARDVRGFIAQLDQED